MNCIFLSFCLVQALLAVAEEKPRTLKKIGGSTGELVAFSSSGKSDEIWFTFSQNYGFASLKLNSTVSSGEKDSKRNAEFRVTPMRIIEYNEETPVEKSGNIFNFHGKQSQWSKISVEQFSVVLDKKDTNIVRMNATMTDGDLKYTMNVYMADRSCFYGSYNLDPDGALIVQSIKGFPYKYRNSSIAVEQVIGSEEASQVSAYLAFEDNMGSLVINPSAEDAKQGRVFMHISDLSEAKLNVKTTDGAMEASTQKILATFESEEQPGEITFEEKFSVNIGLTKSNTNNKGFAWPTGKGFTGSDFNSSRGSMVIPGGKFLLATALLLLIIL